MWKKNNQSFFFIKKYNYLFKVLMLKDEKKQNVLHYMHDKMFLKCKGRFKKTSHYTLYFMVKYKLYGKVYTFS